MTIAVVDADILLYQASSVVEEETCWEGDIWTLHSRVDDALDILKEWKQKATDTGLFSRFVFVTSGHSKTFRHAIFPGYKEHRKDKRKPICYVALKDRLVELGQWIVPPPGIEADDLVSIYAANHDGIMLTIDKDFLTVPGRQMNLNALDGILTLSEDQANYNWMFQTLVGDSADGFPGLKGVGPVKASKILAEGPPYWPLVLEAYEKAGQSYDDALTQARLARILRPCDVDDGWTVKLWSPEEDMV